MLLRALFKLARLLLGLGGLALMLHGLALVRLANGTPWVAALLAAGPVELLLGFSVAYGSFRRFPWEPSPKSCAPAA